MGLVGDLVGLAWLAFVIIYLAEWMFPGTFTGWIYAVSAVVAWITFIVLLAIAMVLLLVACMALFDIWGLAIFAIITVMVTAILIKVLI